MGANTTLWVSRDAALLALAKRAMPFDDNTLERALDHALSDSLYNVRISHDDEGTDDDELLRAMS